MLKLNRTQIIYNLIGSIILKILDHISKIHIQEGFPQLAIFSHDHIGNQINIFGRYENYELTCLGILINSRGLGGGACIDIGANIGNHTLFFSKLFNEVHAFEPAQSTFQLLKINSASRKNIYCYPIGISDKDAILKLNVPKSNIGMAAIAPNFISKENMAEIEIRVQSLNSIEGLAKAKVELIKIDVEGHEYEALCGADEIIRKNKPIILFEQQEYEFDDGTSKVINKLRSYGYHDFYYYARWSKKFPKYLGTFMRVIFGEKIILTKTQMFEKKYYSMILAIPD